MGCDIWPLFLNWTNDTKSRNVPHISIMIRPFLFDCFIWLIFVFLFCESVVLEIYLNQKLQWPQEGLNCEPNPYVV